MKSFAQLFKKYRLRAEFETISAFADALSEKGFFYDESIFSHWQKGTRVPSDRKLVLKIIEIFIERNAIQSHEEADELLASTGLGYLTVTERKNLSLKIEKSSSRQLSKFTFLSSFFLITSAVAIAVVSYFFLFPQKTNYINAERTVPSAVTEPKKLVIGIDATLEPMEFIENEKLVGFDVELGNALAKELDADIEFRNIIFDNLFNSLDQREINMIISAVTITESRKQKYDFSKPYLNAGQVIITKNDNTSIQTVEDLQGKRIATQTGTTNEKEAVKYTSDKLVIRYPDFVQATEALETGKVDALFTDLPNAIGIINKHNTLKIVSDPFTEEFYGIAFIKDDPSVGQINDALTLLEKRGILKQLETKWLHSNTN